MKAFRYERAATVEAAVAALAAGGAILKANGLDVLDRLKERVDQPERVVTLVDVPGLDAIGRTADGGLRLGAMATLATLAASADVAAACPTLAEAAGAAASPALRNRATLGGNLGQHTRCGYYRMTSFACFKRGDALCPPRVAGGVQETAGIFDNGSCACAHPSSLAPVLGAAGATALVAGPKGEGSGGVRRVPMTALYAPPVQGKASDLALDPSEVITAVELPPRTAGTRDGYYEVRQKAAFDWALVVAAVRLDAADGRIRAASVWLGAVAPYPWRATAAEQAAVGASLTPEAFAAIADAAVVGAQPLPGNQYKLDLVRVAVRRALAAAAGRT